MVAEVPRALNAAEATCLAPGTRVWARLFRTSLEAPLYEGPALAYVAAGHLHLNNVGIEWPPLSLDVDSAREGLYAAGADHHAELLTLP